MMVVATTPSGQSIQPVSTIDATVLLARRELRGLVRTPEAVVPGFVVPVVIFLIMLGMFEGFATSFGIENLAAFLLPTSVLLATAFGSSGQGIVEDIERGYFDKLLTTPLSRLALLLGPLAIEAVRMAAQSLLVLLVAMVAGASIATGITGAIAIVILGVLWGVAYSAIGFAVALKTGSGAATQGAAMLWIPLLYLAPAFAPRDSMSGWLATITALNPVTYIVEAMRATALDGWQADTIAYGLLAIAAVGAISLTLAFRALRGRVS